MSLTVICSDGQRMILNENQYRHFKYFTNMIEDCNSSGEIDIPYESRFLDFSIKFYETPEEYRYSCMKSIYFSDRKIVLLLANYLDSEILLDCVIEAITSDIKTMDISETASYFNKTIDNDNPIHKELSWFEPKK